MSGIFIPIEIPKSCVDCPCLNGEYIECNILNKEVFHDERVDYMEERLPDCPMQEIKTYPFNFEPLNDLCNRALSPEWQLEHKKLGFYSPLADFYEEFGFYDGEKEDDSSQM